MRILLLGANGQVGFELHRSLAPLGELVATSRTGTLPGAVACERLDLADPGRIRALVEGLAPAWIVNAAAYTAVDQAEDDRALAARINAEAPGVIGEAARRVDASVLHFSTDYVFAGDATRPYREDDATGPLGEYGRTKLAGEQALAASGARHLVFRTAWVYAARGRNFLRTMLRLAATRERLTVVDDQHGAPTPARLLADVSAHALRTLGSEAGDARCGTYHVASSGTTTWCGFARELLERAAAAGLVGRAPEVAPITSAEFPTRAKRPAYSVLDVAKVERAFALVMPHWRDGVARCIGELVAEA